MSNKKMKNILELNLEDKFNFLNSFDMVLSDCDGVLWTALEDIPNSGKALLELRESGKTCKFLSNNSMRTDIEYVKKFQSIGLPNVSQDDVLHPVKTIINYLEQNSHTKLVFTLADRIFDDALKKAGFEVISSEFRKFESIKDFIDDVDKIVKIYKKVGAVIIDIDMNITPNKIITAQRYLEDPECLFIAGASDNFIQLKENLNTVGSQRFIEILSDLSDRKPVVLGKPGHLLGEFIKKKYNILDPKRVLFIGDALVQDIEFANKCGFQTLLVFSGVTKLEDLKDLSDENQKPDYTTNSLRDFIDFFNILKCQIFY